MSELDLYKFIVQQQRQLETTVNTLEEVVGVVKELVIKVNALEKKTKPYRIIHAARRSFK